MNLEKLTPWLDPRRDTMPPDWTCVLLRADTDARDILNACYPERYSVEFVAGLTDRQCNGVLGALFYDEPSVKVFSAGLSRGASAWLAEGARKRHSRGYYATKRADVLRTIATTTTITVVDQSLMYAGTFEVSA